MTTDRELRYDATGVLDNTQLGLGALLRWVNATAAFRAAGPGRRVVDVGFFASVVDIGHGLGLALCTDGVGSKILVAEMLQRCMDGPPSACATAVVNLEEGGPAPDGFDVLPTA